jgi:AcrR family transcriptional regulator
MLMRPSQPSLGPTTVERHAILKVMNDDTDMNEQAEPDPGIMYVDPETLDAMREGLTPPRAPKQERSREKRNRLLTSALTVFEERGYEGATIDAIAAGAGVSVGVFYSYFRGKRQMLLTLTLERMAQMRFNLADLDPLTTSFTKLEANLLARQQEARRYAGLRRARRELALTDEEVADFERQQRSWVRARLAEIIAKGRGAGKFRADLDDAATATTILALLAQLQDWANDFPPEGDAQLAHSAALMIFRMLTPADALEDEHAVGRPAAE